MRLSEFLIDEDKMLAAGEETDIFAFLLRCGFYTNDEVIAMTKKERKIIYERFKPKSKSKSKFFTIKMGTRTQSEIDFALKYAKELKKKLTYMPLFLKNPK